MSQETMQLLGALISFVAILWNPIKQVCETLAAHALQRLPDNLQYTLKHAAEAAVAAVEQLSHVADTAIRIAPADRKAKAVEYAQAILTHFGLKVPDDVIGTYIEKAVSELADSGYSGNHSYAAGNVANDSPYSAPAQPDTSATQTAPAPSAV